MGPSKGPGPPCHRLNMCLDYMDSTGIDSGTDIYIDGSHRPKGPDKAAQPLEPNLHSSHLGVLYFSTAVPRNCPRTSGRTRTSEEGNVPGHARSPSLHFTCITSSIKRHPPDLNCRHSKGILPALFFIYLARHPIMPKRKSDDTDKAAEAFPPSVVEACAGKF